MVRVYTLHTSYDKLKFVIVDALYLAFTKKAPSAPQGHVVAAIAKTCLKLDCRTRCTFCNIDLASVSWLQGGASSPTGMYGKPWTHGAVVRTEQSILMFHVGDPSIKKLVKPSSSILSQQVANHSAPTPK